MFQNDGAFGPVTWRHIHVEHSQVYQSIQYLAAVRNATQSTHETLLQNIKRDQLLAIGEVAKRLSNGHINPLRRDAQRSEGRRLMLRTLTFLRVSVERKKRLVNRHHSVVRRLSETDHRERSYQSQRSILTELYLNLSNQRLSWCA